MSKRTVLSGIAAGLRRVALSAVLIAAAVPALCVACGAGGCGDSVIAPSSNAIDELLSIRESRSATLPGHIMRWLGRQGLPYLIPRVPRGFPPVKSNAAIRIAATNTPVGPRPRVLAVALISPLASLGPIGAHQIYWAIVLRPHDAGPNVYYVSFVETDKPDAVGSLRHA